MFISVTFGNHSVLSVHEQNYISNSISDNMASQNQSTVSAIDCNQGNPEHKGTTEAHTETIETQEEVEAERPLDEVFSFLFRMAHYVGLCITVKTKEGVYDLCWYGVIPSIICCLICLYSLIASITAAIMEKWPYWYIIMSLPTIFTFIFCIYAYVQVMVTSSMMASYMERAKKLTIKRTWYTHYLVVIVVAYPISLSLCTLSLLPEVKTLPNLLPILVTSFIPAVYDIFMCVFVLAINSAFKKLAGNLQGKETWHESEVQEFYNQWLDLSKLLWSHNKIFGTTLHMRLIVFMVEAMAHLFVLGTLNEHTGNCAFLVFLTALPFMESTFHAFVICSFGEKVCRQDELLREQLLHTVFHVPEGSPEQLSLSIVTSRVVGKPAEMEDTGTRSGVSAWTFVKNTSLVVTYLIVLLQLSPSTARAWMASTQLTNYDYCFLCPNTTMNITYH